MTLGKLFNLSCLGFLIFKMGLMKEPTQRIVLRIKEKILEKLLKTVLAKSESSLNVTHYQCYVSLLQEKLNGKKSWEGESISFRQAS